MHYVELTALKPLCGDYGKPEPGQRFTTDNVTAESLESRGLAERYRDRPQSNRPVSEILAMIHERQTKMQPPVENKMLTVESNKTLTPPKKKRGRPAGSKNKSKE